tara:strand:+ start:1747 stop:1950 length:204 start_codon:yes stop_codon:yes gene_type:complete
MQAVMDGMFPEQAANRAKGNCATCARPIDASLFEGRPQIYRDEYLIAGMCPACQDRAFTSSEEDNLE